VANTRKARRDAISTAASQIPRRDNPSFQNANDVKYHPLDDAYLRFAFSLAALADRKNPIRERNDRSGSSSPRSLRLVWRIPVIHVHENGCYPVDGSVCYSFTPMRVESRQVRPYKPSFMAPVRLRVMENNRNRPRAVLNARSAILRFFRNSSRHKYLFPSPSGIVKSRDCLSTVHLLLCLPFSASLPLRAG